MQNRYSFLNKSKLQGSQAAEHPTVYFFYKILEWKFSGALRAPILINFQLMISLIFQVFSRFYFFTLDFFIVFQKYFIFFKKKREKGRFF